MSSSRGIGQFREKKDTRIRAPKTPNAVPTVPPAKARRRLSVRSCEMILPRVAPRATRTPSSFLRAAERTNISPAILTQEINNTNATAVRRAKSAREKNRRNVAKPCAALASSIWGASSDLKIASGPLVVLAANAVLTAEAAWPVLIPAFKRPISSIQMASASF